jgi:hypothetical protein
MEYKYNMTIKNYSMLVLVSISIIETIYSINMELAGKEISHSVEFLSSFFFAVCVAVWGIEDFKEYDKKPIIGYRILLLFFWPITLIYHLGATRGIDGIHSYFGFLALYMGPFVMSLYAYAYYT